MKETEMPVRDYFFRVISIERFKVEACVGSYVSAVGKARLGRE